MSYDALFSPIKIRGLELKNRVVLPGMNTKMVKGKHDVHEDMVAYHVARVNGGCGLNILEVAAVVPEVHAYLYLGLYNEHHRDELKKVVDAIHAAGGKAGIQLWHGGETPQAFFDKTNKLETPERITVERIHEIVDAYGRAAKYAAEAGFDMVEFHAAHNYLPHHFLNPSMNQRTDEYGNGSLENRARFDLEVIRAIRANITDDMALFMRLDALDELLPKNTTFEETIQVINWAAEAGVDAVDLSRGNARSLATVYEVPPYNLEPGFNMENIAKVKAQVSIPVMGVGRVTTPELANKLIEEGKIDLVAVGRGQLTDPQWCNKAMRGEDQLIRRCIGCTQGCYDKVIDPKATHITCTRNPMLCLEYKGLPKTDAPKKVMVIGAGMGGMLAAQFLKARGHMPTIYEASESAGGRFLQAGLAPGKADFAATALWEAEECQRQGIEIKTGVTVTPELIAQEKPDHVIVAVGAVRGLPEIPGVDGADVVMATDVLEGKVEPKGEVVILGGGLVGIETAQYLVKKGVKDVRVMDAKRVGNGVGMLRSMFLDIQYPGDAIKKSNKSKVVAVGDHTVDYKFTDKFKKTSDKSRHFDTLVIATPAAPKASQDLQDKCQELGIGCTVIGDAKSVGLAIDATRQAYEAAMAI